MANGRKNNTTLKHLETDATRAIPQLIELADGTKCVRLEDFLRERDEARGKAERYRLEANAMMLQRDEARTDLEFRRGLYKVLQNERNEAMEDSLEQARLLGMGSEREAKLISERDEAREALMKIEDLFLECTDIYADFKNMGLIARAALEETK